MSDSVRLPRERSLFDDASGDDDGARVDTALVPVDVGGAAVAPYRPPVPGRSWRNVGRFLVLIGGSGVIGVGVATGLVTLPAAGFFAVALATGQVLAQTWRQNKLGQSVVGGISLGDLDAAQRAAERALTESPPGAMRTLAASNLASVLIQKDLVDDAAAVLDRYPPSFFHMPLTTVLWLNNRAFAHLALAHELTLAADDARAAPAPRPAADASKNSDDSDNDDSDDYDENDDNDDNDIVVHALARRPVGATVDDERASAAGLLGEAERRLERASPRDLGGPQNARKLLSALSGTRAIERAMARDGRGSLASLKRAQEHDDGPSTPFRTIERELCRTEALRLLGRTDEATITLESLTDHALTARQRRRAHALERKMGLR